MAFEQDSFDPSAEKEGMSTFAKLAIGCAVLIVLLCIASAAVVAILAVKGAEWAKETEAAVQEFQAPPGSQVAKLLGEASEASPWTPPAEPATTIDRVDIFFGVRSASMQAAVPVEEYFDTISPETGPQGPQGWSEVKRMFTIFGDWRDARIGFATALRDRGMSQEEYEYIYRLLFLSDIVEVQRPRDIQAFPVRLDGHPVIPDATRAFVEGLADRIQAAPPRLGDGVLLGLGTDQFGGQGGWKVETKGGAEPVEVEDYSEDADAPGEGDGTPSGEGDPGAGEGAREPSPGEGE